MKTNDQMRKDEKSNAPVVLDVLTILEHLGIDRANLPQDLYFLLMRDRLTKKT
ncbi:hypothetical protein ACFPYJ_12190 [Paenibacillus solisilvae]|uniref:Uncharacterized protein n=1 Tax=Paenibacillus solisilvae TaxID=2486751 RepID=A0ABW0VYN1_9BACL